MEKVAQEEFFSFRVSSALSHEVDRSDWLRAIFKYKTRDSNVLPLTERFIQLILDRYKR